MTDEEVRDQLEHIMELAASIGWAIALIQTPEGEILGAYMGSEEWVKRKTGSADRLH